MGRWLMAGIAGGAVLFLWGFIAHAVTPLGGKGMEQIPRAAEGPVGTALKANLPERGFYFFPGLEGGHDATDAQIADWTERYHAGPTGLLLYKPVGEGDPMPPRKLAVQALFNVLCALLAAFVLLAVPAAVGYGRRVLIVTAIALFGSLAIDGSQWIWYEFPTEWFGAQLVTNAVAGLLAGLVIAAIAKPRA